MRMHHNTPIVFGVDPGPDPGIAILTIGQTQLRILQAVCLDGDPMEELKKLLQIGDRPLVAVERFIIAQRTARQTDAAHVETLHMAESLYRYALERELKCQYLPPAHVMPWASDAKLERAGVLSACRTRHQKDAMRHALYAAVRYKLITTEFLTD